jgi:hypothetical protein
MPTASTGSVLATCGFLASQLSIAANASFLEMLRFSRISVHGTAHGWLRVHLHFSFDTVCETMWARNTAEHLVQYGGPPYPNFCQNNPRR